MDDLKLNDTYTNYMNEDGTFNMAKASKSGYGELLLNNYLVESGLSNIFDGYQNLMGTLDKQEQKSLEDAYFTREMGKKYLGEYASNVGVGDVSGNIMDIYSSYQQNKSEISKYFGDKKVSLQQEYESKKMENVANLLQNQFKINVAALGEATQKILFNITEGDFGEYGSREEYLEANREAIGEANYRGIVGALNQIDAEKTNQEVNDIITNLNEGFYGTDENGLPQDFETYYNKVKDKLPEVQQQRYEYQLALQKQGELMYEVSNNLFKGEFKTQEEYINYLDAMRLEGKITSKEYDELSKGWELFEAAKTSSFGTPESGFVSIPSSTFAEFGDSEGYFQPEYYSDFNLPEGISTDTKKPVFKRGDGQYIFATTQTFDAGISSDLMSQIKQANGIDDASQLAQNTPYSLNGVYYVVSEGQITRYTSPRTIRTTAITPEESSNFTIQLQKEDSNPVENFVLDGTNYVLGDRIARLNEGKGFDNEKVAEVLKQNGITSEALAKNGNQFFGFIDGRYYALVVKNGQGKRKYYLYEVDRKE